MFSQKYISFENKDLFVHIKGGIKKSDIYVLLQGQLTIYFFHVKPSPTTRIIVEEPLMKKSAIHQRYTVYAQLEFREFKHGNHKYVQPSVRHTSLGRSENFVILKRSLRCRDLFIHIHYHIRIKMFCNYKNIIILNSLKWVYFNYIKPKFPFTVERLSH